jgi:hypothetical protein
MRATPATIRRAALAGAMLMAAPAGAAAQATTERADAIRQGLKQWIGQHLQSADQSYIIRFDGPITVEPAGASYRARVPAATIEVPGDVTVTMDAVPIDLVPTDRGWYDVTWTLPSTITVTPVGDPPGQLTIASQSNRGVFAPEYETFMMLDTTLSGLAAASPEDATSVRLESVSMRADSQEAAPGVFDSTSTFELRGLDVTDETGAAVVRLDALAFEGTFDDADMAALAAIGEQLNDISVRAEGASDPAQAQAIIGELAAVIEAAPVLLSGLNGGFRLSGLRVDDEETVTIGDTGLTLALTGLAGDASNLDIGVQLNGLGIEPMPEFQRFIPRSVNGVFGLVNLPNAQLKQILVDSIRTSMAAGMDPEMVGMMAAMQLSQAFNTTGGRVEIRSLSIDADVASMDLVGSVTPNAASMFGATMQGTLSIAGMEQLVSEVKAMPDAADAVKALTMLQSMGRQENAADGTPVRVWDVAFNEQGQFLVNGTDMTPLLDQ